jgi:cytochrome c oxidase assembly factor CtaG
LEPSVSSPEASIGVPASLTLIIVVTSMAYLRGWLHSALPAWRAASFFLGLFFIWLAAASPIASFDERMLTAHMVQHLLLMIFAPPLIWLGEPVRALLYDLPRQVVVPASSWPLARQLGGILAQPAFCWLSAAAALVAWHVPALLRLGIHSHAWHLVEHASFLATGLLFWWPVVQPWPSVPRWPRWSMLLYLFLATLPCDVLSGLLVFSDRIAYPMYFSMRQQFALSVLEDQQCAGALMWTCVTVVFLVAGTILSVQLLSLRTSTEDKSAGRESPPIVAPM